MIKRSVWIAMAVLGIGATVFAQTHTPQQHAPKTSKDMACCQGMGDMKGKEKMSTVGCCGSMKMAKPALGTQPEHQKMIEMLKAEDDKLAGVLVEMNKASDDQKLDAVVKSINELAAQHRKSQAMVVGFMSSQALVAKADAKGGCCAH